MWHDRFPAAEGLMAPVRDRDDGNVDREIVDLLFALMDSLKGAFHEALEASDLPMSPGHLLMCLDEPTPMNALARRLGFDASHITSIIDRLEERGLIDRQADPHDRRVKLITINERGLATREQILDRLVVTLPPFSHLSSDQRVQLRDLLGAAVRGQPAKAPA
ncbi:MAG: Transcriptional regulator, MarR family [Acidimicrobiales bacterium]|nr:Transcriptional regulator, MarR family [Acidimicrobiales bacterium]